jgi:hypothetical protein
VHIIVVKIIFDVVGFVPATDDELVKPIMRVNLHDVPEYGSAADFHHRLRAEFRFLGQPGPITSGKNNYFHI